MMAGPLAKGRDLARGVGTPAIVVTYDDATAQFGPPRNVLLRRYDPDGLPKGPPEPVASNPSRPICSRRRVSRVRTLSARSRRASTAA